MKKVMFLILGLAVASSSFAAQKTILVIESYHAENSWDASYLEGLRENLSSDIKLVNFEMNTKRLPKDQHQKQADQAWRKYEEINPDLVILGDDNALKFLGPKFLETKTPVVYLGINRDPRDYIELGKNITGVLERPIFTLAIGSISEIIQPKPDKILVLFDDGTTSQASVAEAFQGKTSLEIAKTKVDLELIGNFETWKKVVSSAKEMGYDAIVVGLYHTLVGRDGKNISADDVMAWTSANSSVPPFGFWDFSVGKGKTIGGFVLYGKEQGKTAAGMATRILKGTEPKAIRPVIGDKGKFLFSKSELAKHQLILPSRIASAAHLIK